MAVNPVSAIGAVYKLVLKHQLTRGRVVVFSIVAAMSVGLGYLIRRDNAAQELDEAASFVASFGLALVAPIVGLLLGSSAIGQWREDETLVYVWLRPVGRWIIGLGATLAACTVSLPASVIPMAAAAYVATGDMGFVAATVVSMSLASVAYTALFVLVGLTVKRALVWGLLYVFVWEFSIAGFAAGAARVSVNSYAKSALVKLSEANLSLALDHSAAASYLVPICIAAGAVGVTTWRLNNTDVA